MPYQRQPDKAQEGIVADLRAAGFVVTVCSNVGGGFPDLIIRRAGFAQFVEVKTVTGTPTAAQLEKMLTPAERKFFAACPYRPPIIGYAAAQIVTEFEERREAWEAYERYRATV